MIKFHDYNPAEPFAVENEFHDIADGKVVLNYTPKKGTVKVKLDGVEAIEATSSNPEAGQFYIDYAVSSDYRMATQQVVFNASDNGKRAVFDYQGVSTLIRAEHFNEIRDFMNNYNEDRARTLVRGEAPPRKGESVENFAKPKLTNTLKIEVIGTVGTMITVDDVAGLEVGGVYTISDGEQYEEITVASINTTDKVVTAESLNNSYDKGWICVSTATMLNGKAFVSGDSQTIVWDKSETWRGTKGQSLKSVSLNAKSAEFDGVVLNSEGDLEVENIPQGEYYTITPFDTNKYFTQTAHRIKEEPKAPFALNYDSSHPRSFYVNEANEIFSASALDYLSISPLKIKEVPTDSTTKIKAIYVPPMWVKSIKHPVFTTGKAVMVSYKEREGYKLLSAFEEYPEGMYFLNLVSTSEIEANVKTYQGEIGKPSQYLFAFLLHVLGNPYDYGTLTRQFPIKDQITLPTGSNYPGFRFDIDTETIYQDSSTFQFLITSNGFFSCSDFSGTRWSAVKSATGGYHRIVSKEVIDNE